MAPKLSICVPSRNRQPYFQITIAGLLRSRRTDVEFVFADNSDEPEIMRAFLAQHEADPRIRFLPSEPEILPMRENWERAVAASTGEWICIIGDDDYVDPEIAGLLTRLELERPMLDVLAWQRVNFDWPDARDSAKSLFVPLSPAIHDVAKEELVKHFFGWSHRLHGPTMPFSVYHSAVSRRVMEAIRQNFGGRYFEHECVDYDNFAKVLVTGETFMLSMRPLSITGTCARANSAALGNLKTFNELTARTFAEFGRVLDDDPFYAGFPFSFQLGVPALVARTQYWFMKTYGYRYEGWEHNFVEGCRAFCMRTTNREMFDQLVEGFKRAFGRWKGGRYVALFGTPEFQSLMDVSTGVHQNNLYLADDVAGIRNPVELYDLLKQMLMPVSELTVEGSALFIHPEDEAGTRPAKMLKRLGSFSKVA